MTIHSFKYETPLLAYRHPKALTMSNGRDPLYIVPFNYTVSFYKDGTLHWLTVPAGFMTDFASVPTFFRRIISRIGRHTEAAVVHDYMYGTKGAWWSRKDADEVFLAAMKAAHVNSIRYSLAYAAVRAGGWTADRVPNEYMSKVEKEELYKWISGHICEPHGNSQFIPPPSLRSDT